MDARDRDLVLKEARSWSKEGLLPVASLAVLETRYAPKAGEAPASLGIGALALFALGGALIGAALITFVTVTNMSPGSASMILTAAGFPLAAFGFWLHRRNRSTSGVEEVLLVAGCVALGAALMAAPLEFGGYPTTVLMGTIVVFVGVAMAVLPFGLRSRSAAPTLAVVLFAVATYRFLTLVEPQGGFFFDELGTKSQLAWLALLAAMAACVWVFGNAPWRPLALGAAIVLLVAPLALFFGDGLGLQSELGELAVGLAFGAILAIALWQRERTAILASALVIAGDAVVFGFDAGGAGLGVVVLLAVAAGLVALAVRFRSRLTVQ